MGEEVANCELRIAWQLATRFLPQQPDAVAAPDPADGAWGIGAAANAAHKTRRIAGAHTANRSRGIGAAANAADKPWRITGADTANGSWGIWSYSSWHNVVSFRDVTIVRAIP